MWLCMPRSGILFVAHANSILDEREAHFEYRGGRVILYSGGAGMIINPAYQLQCGVSIRRYNLNSRVSIFDLFALVEYTKKCGVDWPARHVRSFFIFE